MAPCVLCDRDEELHIHVVVQVARNFHLVQLQLEPRVASLCEKSTSCLLRLCSTPDVVQPEEVQYGINADSKAPPLRRDVPS